MPNAQTNIPETDAPDSPRRMLIYRLCSIGAAVIVAALLAVFWPARWLPHALFGPPRNWNPIALPAARFGVWLVLLFVGGKMFGWLVTWAYQIAVINGLQRLTGKRYRLSPWMMLALSPVVIPVAGVVLCVQLVIGIALMLMSIGRWQCPPPESDGDEAVESPATGLAVLHFFLGLLTLLSATICVVLLPTVIPTLRVPVRIYGLAATGLIILLPPAVAGYRKLRSRWKPTTVLTIAIIRVSLATTLAALMIQMIASPEVAVSLAWLEWGGRGFVALVLASALLAGLVHLFIYRRLMTRPLAPRVRQFMADRLFRKKRIAVFSVLAVTLAVAMELIGVGVTNGMLVAVKDASRRVLADVVMEGPMEGIAYYDEFIAQVKDVTVEVDGKPVKAVAAVTPTIAGFAVARFRIGSIRRTYPVRVMGIRLGPARQTESQYAGVTKFTDGLLLRPHGKDAPPSFELPERWKQILRDRGRPIRPGCIPGKDVLPGIKSMRGFTNCQGAQVVLTTIPVTRMDASDLENLSLSILDFHESGVYEFDSRHFYIDFEKAQQLFAMAAEKDVNGELVTPALCSRILFSINPDVDIDAAAKAISLKWRAFLADPRYHFPRNETVDVETWMRRQKTIINAFEQQKVLFLLVFAVISVVAGFLIMAIFIMIVSEKTRDIGILKSLGASNSDILRTFLSFALIIGVVGATLGFGIARLFLNYINPIKEWLGDLLGVKIFGDDVWLFKTLPTELDPMDTAMIIAGSILVSVLAAYIPARRAAKLPPVKALSYE